MASWRQLPGVVRSRRALTVILVHPLVGGTSPRGWSGPCLKGLLGGGRGPRWWLVWVGGVPWVGGGVGWMGCRGLTRLCRRMVGPGWARPGWAVPGALLGERWASGGCGGVLEACGWRWGARAGRGVG